MNTLIWVIIAIVLLLLAFGIAHWVRRQIAVSRDGLKSVDRSKLRDLDQDAWSQDSWGKKDERDK